MLEIIFYHIDEFNKQFEKEFHAKLITNGKNQRKRVFKLSVSEIMTIAIYYHYSGYKTFKDYYERHVLIHMQRDFSELVSYNRFLELRAKVLTLQTMFLQINNVAADTGISFIDSFPLRVCHDKRSSSHKTFKHVAKKGKTSIGWFFGFKVHVVINHRGEILAWAITPGNIADNNHSIVENLTKNIKGKLFGDKGYISPKIFENLYRRGLRLYTKIRKNMKNKLMDYDDRMLLKKRGVIESVGSILKESLSLEHSRHRSITGFFSHVISSLTAYAFREKKPSIAINIRNSMLSA